MKLKSTTINGFNRHYCYLNVKDLYCKHTDMTPPFAEQDTIKILLLLLMQSLGYA